MVGATTGDIEHLDGARMRDMTEEVSPQPSSCEIAHEPVSYLPENRTLVAVFDSPVAEYLRQYAADLGFRVLIVEPDPARAAELHGDSGDVVDADAKELDENTDVVVTDHHREELGTVLRDVLTRPVRWVGVMGNPRHAAPHVRALNELGAPAADIERVHRPIGLNIGSRTPPEIALATMAGLVADRNGRSAGFHS